jgi:hypothetical protein
MLLLIAGFSCFAGCESLVLESALQPLVANIAITSALANSVAYFIKNSKVAVIRSG